MFAKPVGGRQGIGRSARQGCQPQPGGKDAQKILCSRHTSPHMGAKRSSSSLASMVYMILWNPQPAVYPGLWLSHPVIPLPTRFLKSFYRDMYVNACAHAHTHTNTNTLLPAPAHVSGCWHIINALPRGCAWPLLCSNPNQRYCPGVRMNLLQIALQTMPSVNSLHNW